MTTNMAAIISGYIVTVDAVVAEDRELIAVMQWRTQRLQSQKRSCPCLAAARQGAQHWHLCIEEDR